MAGFGVTDRGPGTEYLKRRLQHLKRLSVEVGIRGQSGRDLVTYAAANEFGVPGHIPERSFLRSTVRDNRAKYTRALSDAAKHVLDGKSPVTVMGRVGAMAVRDVQIKIVRLKLPPNAPSTIARKGSSNPLIDTGRMRQSIDFVVRHTKMGVVL